MNSYVHYSFTYENQAMEAIRVPQWKSEFFKKLWYIYTMEYYSAIKSEILPFASAWMDLEDISKINQRKIITM